MYVHLQLTPKLFLKILTGVERMEVHELFT